MKKNIILDYAILMCTLLQGLYIAFFIGFFAVFIDLQISPSHYDSFYIKNISDSKAVTIFKENLLDILSSTQINQTGQTNAYPLSSIKPVSLYYTFAQVLLTLIFTYLSISEFKKIIESLKNLKTFQQRNVTSFRRIGKYLLLSFLFSCFVYFQFDKGGFSQFHFTLFDIILIFATYILAEIFKEGNKLYHDNQLTV